MVPRIHAVHVAVQRLDPTEADVRVTVDVAGASADLEVKGRWVGPRCALRSTVDVAYPLRQGRVIIPEPALWEPDSPFLYSGIVELWHGGERLDRVTLDHGLRHLTLGQQGLRWNHKPLSLRGVVLQRLTDGEAALLRERGINLILTDSTDGTVEQAADRLGFVVIRRIQSTASLPGPDTPVSLLGVLLADDATPPERPTTLLGTMGSELTAGTQFSAREEGSRLVLLGPGQRFAEIDLS
jgi:hypothetical protein